MILVAPPINAPAPQALAEMFAALESKGECSGPAYFWCPHNHVFLLVMVARGLIVHWHMEPAWTQADADALQRLYSSTAKSAAQLQAGQLAAELPEDVRELLERKFAEASARRFDH